MSQEKMMEALYKEYPSQNVERFSASERNGFVKGWQAAYAAGLAARVPIEPSEELRVDAEPVLYMFTVDGKYYTAKNKAHAESLLRHPDTHLYPDKPEDFPITPLYLSSALIAARQAGRDEQREVDAPVVKMLIALARAAYYVADSNEEFDSEEGRVHSVPGSIYDDLSDALDALDNLPEDLQENVVMTGPAKAEYMLLTRNQQPSEGEKK